MRRSRLVMKTISQSVLLKLLRGYKWFISPLLPAACRYVPTCSEYAVEAIERYGIVRGVGMSIWRLFRCHPFVRGGYDPVLKEQASAINPGQHRACSH